MPSPFPGMNPWLEQAGVWSSLHVQLMTEFLGQLVPQVGPNLIVDIETQMVLRERSAAERRQVRYADVAVLDPHGTPRDGSRGGVAVAAPVLLTWPAVEESTLRWIEIKDRLHRRVVTAIEILSPSNKRSPDREAYLAKRNRLLHAGPVHFVEIDLLRGGKRMPLPDDAPKSDYYALVRRAEDHPRVGYWPIGLRDPLPTLPVPLQEPDAYAHLDLKLALETAYDRANYGKWVYDGNPEPPLSAADAAWALALRKS